jgi:Asp-tRNA(Asn)/Glu-tRNA(Gln) amidotransferase A subunit family amidase
MPDLRGKGPGGLNLLTAAEAAKKIETGGATSVRLVEDCLGRIAAREPEIRAWAYVDREIALAQARARDAEPRRGPLHGVPVGIKDIFDTYDMPTEYGSVIYKGYRPANDTAAVSLLRLAGAVILGKCVTTEFASPVPIGTRNPHDFARSPGVSSSGSAAAVADYMTPLALGSQTGGSTILPAAFCGVVGYKASLTGIDRGGIRHLRPTLDTMGLFARSVEDIVLLRAALTGNAPAKAPAADTRPRIGVCRTINWKEAQPEAASTLAQAASALSAAGASVADVDMPPDFAGIEDAFRVISTVESARSMAAEVPDYLHTMNHWLKDAAAAASRFTAAQYDAAQLHAIRCRSALAEVFGQFDALITPSACGEAVADVVSVSNSAFNRIWTLMYGPCVTIPAFAGPNDMPVGLQIVGPIGADDRTIGLAQWIWDRVT